MRRPLNKGVICWRRPHSRFGRSSFFVVLKQMDIRKCIQSMNYHTGLQLILKILFSIREKQDETQMLVFVQMITAFNTELFKKQTIYELIDIGLEGLAQLTEVSSLVNILLNYIDFTIYDGFSQCMRFFLTKFNSPQINEDQGEEWNSLSYDDAREIPNENWKLLYTMECILCGEEIPNRTPICSECNKISFAIQNTTTGETIENVRYCHAHKKYRVLHNHDIHFHTSMYRPICRMIPYEPLTVFQPYTLASLNNPSLSKKAIKKSVTKTPQMHSLLQVVSMEMIDQVGDHCVKCHRKINKKHYPLEHCGNQKCNRFDVYYRGIKCQGSFCFRKRMVAINLQVTNPEGICQCKIHKHMSLVKVSAVSLC